MQGYNAQKASFSSTIQVKQLGHALLTVTPPSADKNDPAQQEKFLITLPTLHIESLIYGTPFVELEKSTRIASSTGYVAKIDYSGKGWLSGKKNTFTASLYKESEGEKKPLYTVDGQWSESFVIKNARTKEEVDRFVAQDIKTTPLRLAPIDEQDIFESRRAWRDVASAIERGDMDATSVHKSRIENAQRELRKVEKAEGREWERRFFKRVDTDDETIVRLEKMLQLYGNLDTDKTNGIWRFDRERTVDAKPPYYNVGSEALGITQWFGMVKKFWLTAPDNCLLLFFLGSCDELCNDIQQHRTRLLLSCFAFFSLFAFGCQVWLSLMLVFGCVFFSFFFFPFFFCPFYCSFMYIGTGQVLLLGQWINIPSTSRSRLLPYIGTLYSKKCESSKQIANYHRHNSNHDSLCRE